MQMRTLLAKLPALGMGKNGKYLPDSSHQRDGQGSTRQTNAPPQMVCLYPDQKQAATEGFCVA